MSVVKNCYKFFHLLIPWPFLIKKICLTFDDGHKYADQILEKLDKYEQKATFFLCGEYIEANMDVFRKIYDAGHEFGNHSYKHPYLTELSRDEIKSEITQTQKLIEKITMNDNKAKLFRFPYGANNQEIIQIVKELGFTPVFWTIDSRDWTGISAIEIFNNVINSKHLKSGAIILMHTSGAHTSEALDLIIPALKKKKYKMITISEMLHVIPG